MLFKKIANWILIIEIKIFNKHYSIVTVLWFLLATIGVLLELSRGLGQVNNYLIYKNVFWHTIHFQNLYTDYPLEYGDNNHYGPVFSIVILPFAILPDFLGCFFWAIFNAFFLFYAINKLKINPNKKRVILLLSLVEMMTSIQNVQFNPIVVAWLILAFAMVDDENDFIATFYIAAGFLIKLYGIGGLAFFLFSKHKLKFIGYFILWVLVLLFLPMLISSPSFIIQSYSDWYHSLVDKNLNNLNNAAKFGMQDISIMGVFRRVFKLYKMPNYIITLPCLLLYLVSCLRFNQFKNVSFRISYLAITLIGLVVLNSSSESPTYIIAVIGVALWFVTQQNTKKWHYVLLYMVIIITSLSVTDIFPRTVRDHFFIAYALKALPCFCVWLVLLYQLLFKNFSTENNTLVNS